MATPGARRIRAQPDLARLAADTPGRPRHAPRRPATARPRSSQPACPGSSGTAPQITRAGRRLPSGGRGRRPGPRPWPGPGPRSVARRRWAVGDRPGATGDSQRGTAIAESRQQPAAAAPRSRRSTTARASRPRRPATVAASRPSSSARPAARLAARPGSRMASRNAQSAPSRADNQSSRPGRPGPVRGGIASGGQAQLLRPGTRGRPRTSSTGASAAGHADPLAGIEDAATQLAHRQAPGQGAESGERSGPRTTPAGSHVTAPRRWDHGYDCAGMVSSEWWGQEGSAGVGKRLQARVVDDRAQHLVAGAATARQASKPRRAVISRRRPEVGEVGPPVVARLGHGRGTTISSAARSNRPLVVRMPCRAFWMQHTDGHGRTSHQKLRHATGQLEHERIFCHARSGVFPRRAMWYNRPVPPTFPPAPPEEFA